MSILGYIKVRFRFWITTNSAYQHHVCCNS